ncbi:MAG: glycosyltransferase [Anaerolineae bacterium]|nr:glycosyltransferase [Candidatus Roseilinea sp.]MDW8451676.1 glycosyltransferase [Anaerolineae bacterium]
MHIALLHYSAPPVVGGVESVIAHQARCLAAIGHDVRILAARGEQTDPQVRFVRIPLADSRDARVLRVKEQLDRGEVTEEFAALRDDLRRELEHALTGIDVLIAHNVCSLNKNLALTAALHDLFNSPASSTLTPHRAKLILWHHDLAWTTPRYLPELHDGYPWDLLRTAWPGVRQVVVSELRREELAGLMGISPEAISVVPNGLDLARFHKLEEQTQAFAQHMRLTQADLILLLPVRVTPRKNIELALRTLAELRRTFRRPVLIVTGPLGPHNVKNVEYFETLKAIRAELALEDAAYFLAELSGHFLPDEVIADCYRLADALFFPSREEGFGLPMLEAAMSHLPIFCSDIAPLRALGNDDAYYFSPDADPRALAAAITERLLGDAAFRNASRVRSRFTWEQVCARHIVPLLQATVQAR